jgi:hypothetical protein
MRSAWRYLMRVETAETYDLRNDGGGFASVIGFLEYVAA